MKREKVLLALDGTERAFETVRYLSSIPRAKEMEVVLFSVFDEIPEVYWDLGDQANVARRIAETRAWAATVKNSLMEQLGIAKEFLLKAGFEEDQVRTDLHPREKGISRDIIQEAKKGYSAVLAGRRGVARLQEVLLGSVSSRLLQKLEDIPLCLVGKGASSIGKVLVAVDGSKNSMKAVDFLSWLLKGYKGEACIVHVIRAKERELIEEAEARIRPFFDSAKKRLLESGLDSTSLSTQVMIGVESRSDCIVQMARKDRFSTIVLGRRGLGAVQEFFMGRVSNKVVQMSKGLAVWVVN